MASKSSCSVSLIQFLAVIYLLCQCIALQVAADQNATLVVDASGASAKSIADTFFGIFFEVSNEITVLSS